MNIDDIINIDGITYGILDVKPYGGINYYFTNALDENNNPTTEFAIFKVENEEMVKESDADMLKVLSSLFSNSLQDATNEYKVNGGKDNGSEY